VGAPGQPAGVRRRGAGCRRGRGLGTAARSRRNPDCSAPVVSSSVRRARRRRAGSRGALRRRAGSGAPGSARPTRPALSAKRKWVAGLPGQPRSPPGPSVHRDHVSSRPTAPAYRTALWSMPAPSSTRRGDRPPAGWNAERGMRRPVRPPAGQYRVAWTGQHSDRPVPCTAAPLPPPPAGHLPPRGRGGADSPAARYLLGDEPPASDRPCLPREVRVISPPP